MRAKLVVTVLLSAATCAGALAGEAVAGFPGGNGRIAFSDASPQDGVWISVIDPDGSRWQRLTTDPSVDFNPTWSAGGDKIAFTSRRAGSDDIYTMSPDGSGVTRVTFDPAGEEQPSWSPDGNRLAFVRFTPSGGSDIYVLDVPGGTPQRLTGAASGPAWSPDGTRIAFQGATPEGGIAIYTIKPDGSELRQITNQDGYAQDIEPDWSPDGKRIAFVRGPAVWDIYLVDSHGGNEVFVRRSATNPAWSPDGTKILFAVETGLDRDIHSMNVDGTAQNPVVGGPGEQFQPSWAPTRQAPGLPTQSPTASDSLRSRCTLSVTARGRRLGKAGVSNRRPQFPTSGAFKLRAECNRSTALRARGVIVVRGMRSRPRKTSLQVGPVQFTTKDTEARKMTLRFRPATTRRIVAKLRRGSHVSGLFSVRAISDPRSKRVVVKVRRFRR